jgi:septal ring factor EnvC (AmiA/AmiB activator)
MSGRFKAMYLKVFLLVNLWCVVGMGDAFGQSVYLERKALLEGQQRETRNTIDQIAVQLQRSRSLLDVTLKEVDQQYRLATQLNRQIQLQEEKIRAIEQEISQSNQKINLIENDIAQLERDIDGAISSYKETLTYVYKFGKMNTLSVILTAPSLNTMLNRSIYLRRFEAFREAQVEQIRMNQASLQTRTEELREENLLNERLKEELSQESSSLVDRKERLDRRITQLQRDKGNLERQIASYQNEQEELEDALDSFSAQADALREAELERRRRLQEAQKIAQGALEGLSSAPSPENPGAVAPGEDESGPSARGTFAEEDDSEALLVNFEDQFQDQKGSLPWPVDQGVVTKKFGVQVHPVFGTRVNSLGVEISTAGGADVTAVSDGIVVAIQPIQGYGDVVILNHGRYKTAYGNLSDLSVRRNQVLSAGDKVGASGTASSSRGEVVFFVVRDGTENVNPEIWLD